MVNVNGDLNILEKNIFTLFKNKMALSWFNQDPFFNYLHGLKFGVRNFLSTGKKKPKSRHKNLVKYVGFVGNIDF